MILVFVSLGFVRLTISGKYFARVKDKTGPKSQSDSESGVSGPDPHMSNDFAFFFGQQQATRIFSTKKRGQTRRRRRGTDNIHFTVYVLDRVICETLYCAASSRPVVFVLVRETLPIEHNQRDHEGDRHVTANGRRR